MRKFFTFFVASMLCLAAFAETKALRVIPGVWSADNAVIAAWAWSTAEDGAWAKFEGEGDTLSAAVDAKATDIIFVRMDPNKEFGWDAEWNRLQTKIDWEKPVFKVTDWGTGEWVEAASVEPIDPQPGEHIYTVVGNNVEVFGKSWDPTFEANDMIKQEDGIYLWERTGLVLEGHYEFKICQDHAWDVTFPANDNLIMDIEEKAIYTFTLTFDPNPELDEMNKIHGSATKTGEYDPSQVEYFLKNNWGGEADWTWKKMSAREDGKFELLNVVFGGTGVNLNTAQTDEGAKWFATDAIAGDKIQAKDVVSFLLEITAEEAILTATLVERPEPGEVEYFLKNNWNAEEGWSWKKMSAREDGKFELANVVFGGTGVNYNTIAAEDGAEWIAAEAFLGDKIEAKDTVTLVLDPAGEAVTITATLIGRPSDEPIPTIEDGFYLVGTMNGWEPKNEFKFVKNEIAEVEEYSLEVRLETGQGIKVLGLAGETKTWYPENEGTEYVVDEVHAGLKTIYFRPAGNEDWAAFGGFIWIEGQQEQGLGDVQSDKVQCTKLLRNGQLYLMYKGTMYNVQGQVIK